MFYGAPMATLRAASPNAIRNCTMIADHLGVTGEMVKQGKLAEGVRETAALAKYPNVSVKLSTTPFYSSESYPFRDMTEHIRRLFDAFGPRRCYWGTDLTNSYQQSHLPAARHAFHRDARFPLRRGQRMDHGPRYRGAAWVEIASPSW